jgi:uracil-DNA glycosylase
VAEVRVSQAEASGIPPRLQDLLVEESWRDALLAEFQKPYMRQLETFLVAEWAAGPVFPPKASIFRCV